MRTVNRSIVSSIAEDTAELQEGNSATGQLFDQVFGNVYIACYFCTKQVIKLNRTTQCLKVLQIDSPLLCLQRAACLHQTTSTSELLYIVGGK